MPSPAPILHFEDVSEQWQKQSLVAQAQPIKIFSPYITGRQTFELTGGHTSAEVYTVFDAELFASGASSLQELRSLIEAQVSVYHLPDLHAKIVWIPGAFLSIGSQNLTQRGRQNREATVAIGHQPWMSTVEAELQRWIVSRIAISIEMVDEMAEAIGPLVEACCARRTEADEVTNAVFAANAARLEAVERQRMEAEQMRLVEARRRLDQLQEIRRESIAGQRDRASVDSFRRLTSSLQMTALISEHGSRLPGESLVAPSGRSFLRWSVQGQPINLLRFHRYLCVVPELNRFGWARVTQGFITFVERVVSRSQVRFLGAFCSLSMKSIDPAKEPAFNMAIEVNQHSELGAFKLHLWVDADGVSLVDIIQAHPGIAAVALRERWAEVRTDLLRVIASPFKYLSNLTGENAGKFFYGDPGSEFNIRLAMWGNLPVLVAEAVER